MAWSRYFAALVAAITMLVSQSNAASKGCQVVSIPGWTKTSVAYSGDVNTRFDITYTTETTLRASAMATVQSFCYSIASGQTITSMPTSLPSGVVCETSILSGTSTKTSTSKSFEYTPRTSVTPKPTETGGAQPTVYVTCATDLSFSALRKFQQSCIAVSTLTWASLVITFITVQLTWWIFEIPLFWKSGAGYKYFFDAVSWSCVRTHSPASAAVIAMGLGADVSEYARIFYLGLKMEDSPEQWKTWKLCLAMASDLLNVANTIMTIYQSCTLPVNDSKRFGGMSLWTYQTLPISLIGLCLLLGERAFPRSRKGTQLLVMFTFVVLVAAVVAATLVLKNYDKASNAWASSIGAYIAMAFPMIYLGPALAPACVLVAIARVGGIVAGAFGHYGGGLPYCLMRGSAFGAVYVSLGGIAAILAVFGVFYHAGPRARKSGKPLPFLDSRETKGGPQGGT